VAILTRDDLTVDERERLLALWERVSFRIYGICGKDARTRVGDYVRLARSTVRDRLKVEAIEDGLRNIGAEFPIETAVDALRDSNCYTDWQQDLRYLLFRYEEHLAAQAGQTFDNEQWARIWEAASSDSIEHIHPQSLGEQQRSETGIFVHRLGNLMLLPPGLNSRLQAQLPSTKREAYIKTGLHHACDVAGRLASWDRDAVIQREEELIAWATTQWAD